MLGLLVAIAAAARGLPERAPVYLAIAVAAAFVVAVLMRRDVRRRRAEEALLPTERRPPRRTPRQPIRFPIGETLVTFAIWYAVAIAVDRAIGGTTSFLLVAAIAPFAAFILTTLTIAGRHMAFRLTAEEFVEEQRAKPDQREAG
jgi:hypothetical protein